MDSVEQVMKGLAKGDLIAEAARLREVGAGLIRTYDHHPESVNIIAINRAAARLEQVARLLSSSGEG